jgi:hypothetical protein
MWPWAAVYTAQIAVGMLVWSVLELEGGRGWFGGVAAFLPFAALTYALWKARPRFQPHLATAPPKRDNNRVITD